MGSEAKFCRRIEYPEAHEGQPGDDCESHVTLQRTRRPIDCDHVASGPTLLTLPTLSSVSTGDASQPLHERFTPPLRCDDRRPIWLCRQGRFEPNPGRVMTERQRLDFVTGGRKWELSTG